MGWSSFEEREARSKLAYKWRLRNLDNNRLIARLFNFTENRPIRSKLYNMVINLQTKYLNNPQFSEELVSLTDLSLRQLNSRIKEISTGIWQKQMESKSSLSLYREFKHKVAFENIYD